MTIVNPFPLGLDYSAVVFIVDKISSQTGLRAIQDFETLLAEMGGLIERVSDNIWNAPNSAVLEVTALKTFVAHLPLDPTPLDRLLLACALGHYILHSKEGSAPSKFYRFAKDQTSLEALWFGMAVVIPDQAFAVAESTGTEQIRLHGGTYAAGTTERSFYPHFFSPREEEGIINRLRLADSAPAA